MSDDKALSVEDIRGELISAGKKPEDFNVRIEDGKVQVIPRWTYEPRKLIKEESKPINEDIDILAESTVFTKEDLETLAEAVQYLMLKVEELEGEIDG